MAEANNFDKSRVDYEGFQTTMKAMIRKSMLREVDRSPSKSPLKSMSPSRSGSISPTRLTLRKKENCLEDSYKSPTLRKDKANKVISPEKGNPFRNSNQTFNL